MIKMLWLYWFHCFIVIMGNRGACRCRVRALNERTKTTNQIQSIPCSYAPTDMRITVKLYIWVLIHQTALFVESTNHFWFRRIALHLHRNFHNTHKLVWGAIFNCIWQKRNIFNLCEMRLDFDSTSTCCTFDLRSHNFFYCYSYFINWDCILSASIGFRLMTLSISCVPLDNFRCVTTY